MNLASLLRAAPDGAPPACRVARRPAPSGIAMGCVLLLALSGCSHSLSQPPACDGGDGGVGQPAVQPSLRFLVGFHAYTVGQAPEVVAQLQSRAQACVRYISSVSPTLHVYAVVGGADAQTVRAQWLQWPAVSRVDADVRMDKH